MGETNARVRHVVYCLALGVNQLIDKGHTESSEILIDKMFNGEFISYLTAKYKDENIQEFEFSDISKEKLPEVIKLLENYGSVLPLKSFDYYGVGKNGLVLASSVLAHILYDEK